MHNQPLPAPRAALTEIEAAVYLGVSRSLLRQQRMSGSRDGHAPAIPYVRLGRMVRYRITDLDAYLTASLVDPHGRGSDIGPGRR